MTIALLNLNHLGDSLFPTPAIEALREAYPGARLAHWMARPTTPLFAADPRFALTAERPPRELRAWIRQALELRRRWRPDIVVGFCDNSLGLSLAARILGGRRRLGYRHPSTRGFFTHYTRFSPAQGHMADSHLALVGLLGIPIPANSLSMCVAPSSLEEARALLATNGVDRGRPLLTLSLGASRDNKKWPPDRFREVALAWQQDGGAVALVGGPQDQPFAEQVGAGSPKRMVNGCGLRIDQSAALLKLSDVTVSADTGPLHMAVAVGTPVVALFGPTDPERTGPYHCVSTVLRRMEGCPGCKLGPKAEGHTCMAALEAGEVLDAARGLLTP
ncbi:MAG TPA: glycosyltransferase family 9 protein [Armatimonadota bacterium]|jgi:ADP-heptose:LPS heptosyltransferase